MQRRLARVLGEHRDIGLERGERAQRFLGVADPDRDVLAQY
jgi:hypothetical protein